MKFLYGILILSIGLCSFNGWSQEYSSFTMSQTEFEIAKEKTMNSMNRYGLGTTYYGELDPIYTYYQNKNWEKGTAILESISDAQILESDKSIEAGLLGFVSGLILDNPDKLEELKNMNLSTDMQDLIKKGSQIALRAQKVGNILKSQHGKPFTGKQLDSFWGLFFATGDQRIPEEIAYFGMKNSKPKKVENGQVLVDESVMFAISALASIHANAATHEKVKAAMDNLPTVLFYENALEYPDTLAVQEWDRFE